MSAPRRIPALTCGACDRRSWRKTQPVCPEAFLCDSCLDWIEAFNHGNRPGTVPITGPIKSVRMFLANQPINGTEIYEDTSPWIVLTQPRHVVERWAQTLLTTEPRNRTILQAVTS